MNATPGPPFTVACIQAAPVFLDRDATIEKCCALLHEAAAHGASLAVFPEAFVPCYPFWVWHIPAGRTRELRELYAMLLENSVTVGDAATARLASAAREAGIAAVIGVNERNDESSGSTLHNTLFYFDADGTLLGRHRKLVPTAGERLIHGPGDGSTLDVYDLAVGRVSGLICWENYMPLARYALYASGVQIYVAPTWDRGEPWLSTLRHIAKEGRAVVIGSCIAMRSDDVPPHFEFMDKYLAGIDGWINPGDSVIVNPDGKILAGPAHEQETILYAEIDPRELAGPRWQLDVAGHYARPDVFQLLVDRSARPAVRWLELETDG
jgi:nitrilase